MLQFFQFCPFFLTYTIPTELFIELIDQTKVTLEVILPNKSQQGNTHTKENKGNKRTIKKQKTRNNQEIKDNKVRNNKK